MKKLQALLLCAIVLLAGCHKTGNSSRNVDSNHRVFVDMAGRSLVVPKHIKRVYGMSPVGTVFTYTLAPETLLGWNYQPTQQELDLLAPQYRDLPVLGGWFGKNNTGNLEQIVKAQPDILLSMGEFMNVDQAERIQAQIHIPVVILNGKLRALPDAYQKAGELLEVQERAASLASYSRQTLDEIENKIRNIPPEKRRRYYYAEGPTGLETEPGGTSHAESMDFAGGMNVASVPEQKGYGHSPVSMEQVLNWNPQIIISGYDHSSSPGAFYQMVWKNKQWQRVDAVKHRQVYETPQYPSAWIDRPPSANRLIGEKWLANLFYPDLFSFDIRSETRSFYAQFYHVQLSDQQLNQLLATATRNHE